MIADSPKVSIVIPVLNEAGHKFEELLKKLSVQEGDFERELIVVDSGSTDGTAEMAERHGATVHRIPKSEFSHGGTRNLGISLARGKYVALTVGDAVPLDEWWLASMVENLERDEGVAGVYSRQVPHPEASALTRVLVSSLRISSPERREQFAGGPERYRALPPGDRRRLAAFDDVSSCIRRSAWEEISFEKTNFGEDVRWGKRVVEAGYKIVYEPRSAVFHSHERGPLYDLRRYYIDQRLLSELFGLRLAPNLKRLLVRIYHSSRDLYRLLRRDEAAAKRGAPWAAAVALRYAVLSQIGNYLGAKSEPLARLSPRAFHKFHHFLTKGWGP